MQNEDNMIEFGLYKRNNDKELLPIRWRVLISNGKSMLIITENAIDVLPFYTPLAKPLEKKYFADGDLELNRLISSKSPRIFDESGRLYVDPFGVPITNYKYAGLPLKYQIPWEKSTLRKYLNGEFLHSFTNEEKERILNVTVRNGVSPINEAMPGGEDTRDKVFLLDSENTERYFPTKESRMCKPTLYAMHKSEKYQMQHYCLPRSNGCCTWWLRTVGLWEQFDPDKDYRPNNQHCVVTVDHNGDIDLMGMPADAYEFVRPVMLIKV